MESPIQDRAMLHLITIDICRFGRAWRVIYNGSPLGDDRGFSARNAAIREAADRVRRDIDDARLHGCARRYKLAIDLFRPARKLGAI
jgi:hypothetical protein